MCFKIFKKKSFKVVSRTFQWILLMHGSHRSYPSRRACLFIRWLWEGLPCIHAVILCFPFGSEYHSCSANPDLLGAAEIEYLRFENKFKFSYFVFAVVHYYIITGILDIHKENTPLCLLSSLASIPAKIGWVSLNISRTLNHTLTHQV